ncbi:zf-HC2 domain-containing protein [Paenibacillus hodogayensis]|uniref:Zf-HC2 domain-containing protein n=1 Tax=Paenibacillus hodogayensis TaxID=279208 RepID=A0ABV5VWY5_9BACL
MERKLDCKIVQDLLPTYIEGLTSEYTNKAIQEHLATCTDCRTAWAAMTRETQQVKAAPQKQINFLKKIKRRQWIVTGISVLISAAILIGCYYAFGSRNFPIPSSELAIRDVYQMKDGSIHYSLSANVESYVGRQSSHSNGESETVRVYENRRLTSKSPKSPVSLPDRWSTLHDSNSNKEKTSIYYEGKNKNDRIVIWKKGMDIPKATAEQETKYQNYLNGKR